MASTSIIFNKNKPLIIAAVVGAGVPNIKQSHCLTVIGLLTIRMAQIENNIKQLREDHQRVKQLRETLLNDFPEGTED